MNPLNPHYRFIRNWDLVLALAILYNALIIPFQICFNTYLGTSVFILDLLCDVLFLSDTALRFYRGYYSEGLMVKDFSQIRRRYLRGWFIFDMLSILPIDILFGAFGNSWLRLPRLIRLPRILRYFRIWQTDLENNLSVIRLMKLLVAVILMAHLLACAWFKIGYYEASQGTSSWFFSEISLLELPLFDQYIRALYWSLTTMTTVGYGDITPTSTMEITFVIVAMCVSVSLYAYIVGSMASIVANLDSTAHAFRKRMDSVNDYMRFRNIPEKLQVRIRDYFDYVWSRNKGLDEENILHQLPVALRTDVSLYLHRDIIQKVPLFQGADKAFLDSLVLMLHPVSAAPGDFIIRHGEVGQEMFFISHGTVEVVSEDGSIIFATLTDGAFFGEIALLFAEKRTATIRATSFCDLFYLGKKEFTLVLQNFPEFAEQMMEIAKDRYKKQ